MSNESSEQIFTYLTRYSRTVHGSHHAKEASERTSVLTYQDNALCTLCTKTEKVRYPTSSLSTQPCFALLGALSRFHCYRNDLLWLDSSFRFTFSSSHTLQKYTLSASNSFSTTLNYAFFRSFYQTLYITHFRKITIEFHWKKAKRMMHNAWITESETEFQHVSHTFIRLKCRINHPRQQLESLTHAKTVRHWIRRLSNICWRIEWDEF